jgi:hypothetical protein
VHESRHSWLVERLDDVEGRKDAAFDAAIQRAGSGQRHELTVVVCADVGDAPAMPADEHQLADAYVVSGFALAGRASGTTQCSHGAD